MKAKRLTKFGAVLSAALVLLSGILSVSAASVPQAVIDTDRKASVSLYKYDFTSAHADGVLGDNTYISTGYADENVENTLMPYAIEGVVFSYAKIADLAVHAETKDGEHQNMLLYKLPGGDKTTALMNCLDLTSEDAYKTDRGDLYFTSDTLIDALSDHLNTAESQAKKRTGSFYPPKRHLYAGNGRHRTHLGRGTRTGIISVCGNAGSRNGFQHHRTVPAFTADDEH